MTVIKQIGALAKLAHSHSNQHDRSLQLRRAGWKRWGREGPQGLRLHPTVLESFAKKRTPAQEGWSKDSLRDRKVLDPEQSPGVSDLQITEDPNLLNCHAIAIVFTDTHNVNFLVFFETTLTLIAFTIYVALTRSERVSLGAVGFWKGTVWFCEGAVLISPQMVQNTT